MHPDQLPTNTDLVRRLIADQHPRLASLPISHFASTGTENAIYRLGEQFVARLPLRPGKEAQINKAHRWLPTLAAHLPLAIPEPVAMGAPTDDYPSAWSICRWLPGTPPTLNTLADPCEAARRLARFVRALRSIDVTEGPPPGNHNFWRGVPLRDRDTWTRDAIDKATNLVDTRAVTSAWEAALEVAPWSAPSVWVHGDLTPANLLCAEGRLCGVIDWGGLGVGDPATDLLPAWNLFEGPSREAFRSELAVDDATWARGKGLALSVGIVALPYYKDTNPAMARWARGMIDAVLGDG